MNKLQAMEVFIQVVDCGSFTKAADMLNLPKATVSTLVQTLESTLSVKLLHRTTRQVMITSDGAAYYERCVQILSDVRDAEESLSRHRLSPSGRRFCDELLQGWMGHRAEIDESIRVKDLSDEQLIALRDHIEGNYKVEGDLRREVAADIRRKVEIGSYEGIRHRRGLPVRGQRTKTNARTRKGPKRTVAGKKKAR